MELYILFRREKHDGLPLARILQSDQVSLSHPLAEVVVTMKGKEVVHHQTAKEPRLARMSRRGKGLHLVMHDTPPGALITP